MKRAMVSQIPILFASDFGHLWIFPVFAPFLAGFVCGPIGLIFRSWKLMRLAGWICIGCGILVLASLLAEWGIDGFQTMILGFIMIGIGGAYWGMGIWLDRRQIERKARVYGGIGTKSPENLVTRNSLKSI
jgi:hypothetical protein